MNYSFCETLAAFVWHIRPLSDDGLKLGGGADTKTLCGLKPSWDINVPIHPETLEATQHLKGNCKVCVKEFLKLSQA